MNTKKLLAMLTGCVMSASMLAGMPVSAAEYAQGDVDMDGYITGHDAAMVSRYLNVDSNLFSEEQLALADMNADGVVDQTDADLIFENKVYYLGGLDELGMISCADGGVRTMRLYAAYAALHCNAAQHAGTLTVSTDAMGYDFLDDGTNMVNPVTKNLLDADGDGEVTVWDSLALVGVYSSQMTFIISPTESINGRYDLSYDVVMSIDGIFV